jgi:hypothetical protein
MARVTGIGGVFLRSADPKALGAWYAKHLGVEVGDYGATWRGSLGVSSVSPPACSLA